MKLLGLHPLTWLIIVFVVNIVVVVAMIYNCVMLSRVELAAAPAPAPAPAPGA